MLLKMDKNLKYLIQIKAHNSQQMTLQKYLLTKKYWCLWTGKDGL